MTTDVGKFKNTMFKFINQLKQWGTPQQQKEIEKYQFKIETGMKIDGKGSIGLFVDSVIPFAHHIMQGDDDYFLKEDLVEDSEYLQLHDQLKSWWPSLDEKQRSAIRNKVKLLLMLAAIAVKSEELRVVINEYRDPTNPLEF